MQRALPKAWQAPGCVGGGCVATEYARQSVAALHRLSQCVVLSVHKSVVVHECEQTTELQARSRQKPLPSSVNMLQRFNVCCGQRRRVVKLTTALLSRAAIFS